MPKHGEIRNYRMERRDGDPIELIDRETGAIVYRGPASSMEETVSERWCVACENWIEVRGVLGAIKFMEHDDHAKPFLEANPLEAVRVKCPHCMTTNVYDAPKNRTASFEVTCTKCGKSAGYIIPNPSPITAVSKKGGKR